jgi:hypothetical protein
VPPAGFRSACRALAATDRARELLPESRDALAGPDYSLQRAWVPGLPEIARLLQTPWDRT